MNHTQWRNIVAAVRQRGASQQPKSVVRAGTHLVSPFKSSRLVRQW